MQDFTGKTAFVTGGASGIGLALGGAFVAQGMNVVLADIEAPALDAACEELSAQGGKVRGVVCDVADAASVSMAAEQAFDAFGNVHIVCNNAGVAGAGGVETIDLDVWRWVMDVNVMSVVHGVSAFLPRMRSAGEGGHFVNTASMAGLQSGAGFHPYAASKYAVVSMSEGLAKQLQPLGIGVTVLCPSFVKTNIGNSARNRQARYGQHQPPSPESASGQLAAFVRDQLAKGLEPDELARRTIEAIRQNDLYVFTHPEWYWEIDERFAAIEAAMSRWSQYGET